MRIWAKIVVELAHGCEGPPETPATGIIGIERGIAHPTPLEVKTAYSMSRGRQIDIGKVAPKLRRVRPPRNSYPGPRLIHPFDTEVAIVGLGPVGGVLAALLDRRGITVTVFERNREVYPKPRAVHFDAEVMRVLQDCGLAEEVAQAIQPVRGMDLLGVSGNMIYQYRPKGERGPLGWAEGYMFEQPSLERTLRARLVRSPGVDVRLGHEVESIEQGLADSGVVIRSFADGEEHVVRARYVVGCCGAQSLTRRTIETGMDDYCVDSNWVVLDVVLADPSKLPDVTVQYCEPERPCTYVPLPGARRRFEFMLLPGEDPEQMSGPGAVSTLLKRWLRPEEYRMDRAAVYTFHGLVAKQWRDGRIMIAGDAAHQMPPFLGQGFCAGVRDVANLAWKLDLVLRGVASESLLDTYQLEREPHVRQIIETDIYLGNIIQTTDTTVAQHRDEEALKSGRPSELSPRLYPIGDALCSGPPPSTLPFPQPMNAEGELHDSTLGTGFALVGDITPRAGAARALDRLGAVYIPEPWPELCAWLKEHGVRAAIVRPDRLVLALASDAEELDNGLSTLMGHVAPKDLGAPA